MTDLAAVRFVVVISGCCGAFSFSLLLAATYKCAFFSPGAGGGFTVPLTALFFFSGNAAMRMACTLTAITALVTSKRGGF